MERLTECVGYHNDKPIYKTKIDMRKIGSVDILKNKLGDYEDAEEQGLLLRLPCKAGDTVYKIMNNTDECLECPHFSCFYGGVDSMCSKEKGNTKFEPRYADMPLCEKQFLEILEYRADFDYIVRNLSEFGKTIFLSKKDAVDRIVQMAENSEE